MRAVAFLRAINLGPRNRVPMKELRELLESRGLGDVSTYVQSGNVVFTAPSRGAAALAGSLEQAVADAFGVKASVLVRTQAELKKIAAGHPFGKDEREPTRLHVLFLRDKPTNAKIGKLEDDRFLPDRFAVEGREVFLHYPNGQGRSKLTIDYFERRLETVGTARNWRTVLALRDML
jgi:uncharacterized protein (DUF1697 family)